MAFVFQDDIMGLPPVGSSGPLQSPAYPGMLGHAVDPGMGGGEFVYLPGVAGCTAGSLVTYNQTTASGTALAVVASHGAPAAVAMAAVGAPVAGVPQYGWFQIMGAAKINKTATATVVGHGVLLSATPGLVAEGGVPASPLASGMLVGALVATAQLTTDPQVTCQISSPTVA